ncbi:MAG: esterase family protein [Ruminococcaceae bacterium]|nr:esterase family protein [Oscillospiraceae bacterium]
MKCELSFYSHVLGKSVNVNVIYPNGGTEAPFKVLYLLHGLGDNYSFWSNRTTVETLVENTGLVVVMPDGDVSWYCDMNNGRKYFTYITQELPGLIRSTFSNISGKREDTFIGGASMGGYGAFKAAMTYPENYGKVFGFSSAVDMEDLLPWIDRTIMENAWGPMEEAMKSEHSSYILADKLKKSGKNPPSMYMWCGFDDFLYNSSVKFSNHLKELGMPIEYRESDGNHDWPCWDRELKTVLKEFLLK